MNSLFGKPTNNSNNNNNNAPMEMQSMSKNNPYSLDGLGDIPTLNAGAPNQNPSATMTQSQYNRQFNPQASSSSYNPPPSSSSSPYQNQSYQSAAAAAASARLGQTANYQTIAEEGQQGDLESGGETHEQRENIIDQVKEWMKLEGKTPLCKALTYMNFALVIFILYLILKSF